MLPAAPTSCITNVACFRELVNVLEFAPHTSCLEAMERASCTASMSPARIAACMVLISRDNRAASACASCSLQWGQETTSEFQVLACC